MPVPQDCPEPLKTALEDMEAIIQSKKSSILFAAPEMQDLHWGELQMNLAQVIEVAIDSAREDPQLEEAKDQMQGIIDQWEASDRNPNFSVGASFLEHALKIINGEIKVPEKKAEEQKEEAPAAKQEWQFDPADNPPCEVCGLLKTTTDSTKRCGLLLSKPVVGVVRECPRGFKISTFGGEN